MEAKKFNMHNLYGEQPLPMILESAGGDNDDGGQGAVDEIAILAGDADRRLRSNAMAVLTLWVAGGVYTYSELVAYAAGFADLDGDEELSDAEQEYFGDLMEATADAAHILGGDADNIQKFIDDEDDEAGALLGEHLSKKLDEMEADDLDLQDDFALGDDDMVLEASFRKKKVMRDGKVKIVRKRVGKVRLSSAQKMALKKARRKAHTGMAKKRRMKSVKKGLARGLYKGKK